MLGERMAKHKYHFYLRSNLATSFDQTSVETICIRASPRVKRSSILLNNGLSDTEERGIG